MIGTDKDLIQGTDYMLDEEVVGKMMPQGKFSTVLEMFCFLG